MRLGVGWDRCQPPPSAPPSAPHPLYCEKSWSSVEASLRSPRDHQVKSAS